MIVDRVSEAIAHFIGVFELELEHQRARAEYNKFASQEDLPEESESINLSHHNAHSSYQLKDAKPDVDYTPPDHEIIELRQSVEIDPVYFEPAHDNFEIGTEQPFLVSQGNLWFDPAFLYPAPPVPGSIGLVVKQLNTLTDNDAIVDDDFEFDFLDTAAFEQGLQDAALIAGTMTAVEAIRPPGSEEAIAEIIDHARLSVADIETAPSSFGATVSVFNDDETGGIHVDGVLVDTAPEISQIMPSPAAPDDDDQDMDEAPQFEIKTGSNTAINEAVLAESWIDAPVQMVGGDYVSLNIISQTNVLIDSDGLPDFLTDTLSDTHSDLVQNIAAFVSSSTSNGEVVVDVTAGMPASWSITTLEGNLLLLNWLEQINHITDNDVVSATASGTDVFMQTGDNLALGAFSLVELGYRYDLIIVSGDVYHGNIIHQTNVLFDNDFVTTGSGQQGADGISGGGNALWNVASIEQTGIDTTLTMNDEMVAAIARISDGDLSFEEALASSPELAGIAHLNVLYIDGSLLDLQYVNQVNIVGDADQVALNLDDSDMEWTVETGDNTLLNVTAIVDAGIDSSVYVSGDIYSDELLYQAELVTDETITLATDTTQLASEAVLFLSDDMLSETTISESDAIAPTPSSAPHVDVMQSMLA